MPCTKWADNTGEICSIKKGWYIHQPFFVLCDVFLARNIFCRFNKFHITPLLDPLLPF